MRVASHGFMDPAKRAEKLWNAHRAIYFFRQIWPPFMNEGTKRKTEGTRFPNGERRRPKGD